MPRQYTRSISTTMFYVLRSLYQRHILKCGIGTPIAGNKARRTNTLPSRSTSLTMLRFCYKSCNGLMLWKRRRQQLLTVLFGSEFTRRYVLYQPQRHDPVRSHYLRYVNKQTRTTWRRCLRKFSISLIQLDGWPSKANGKNAHRATSHTAASERSWSSWSIPPPKYA